MRIAIVDDDANWREWIKKKIIQCRKQNEITIDVFSSGESYLTSKNLYDISFIDIEMPGIDGFETISRAREAGGEGLYVILTTHAEMSRRGYFVNAFRYIDKAHLEELEEAINSAAIVLGRNKMITVNVINDGPRNLVLKNIIYIETEKHYILIHTKHGEIRCSNNLRDLEKVLPENWFCGCHNVFIVNLDEIKKLDDRIAYLSNGHDIDISHRKMREFKRLYLDRRYECANA